MIDARQFPPDFFIHVLQWVDMTAKNIFSKTLGDFLPEIRHFEAKQARPCANMTQKPLRKHLSMPGMPGMTRKRFDDLPNPIKTRGTGLSGCPMQGPAVFSFTMPSPLRFDRSNRGGAACASPAPMQRHLRQTLKNRTGRDRPAIAHTHLKSSNHAKRQKIRWRELLSQWKLALQKCDHRRTESSCRVFMQPGTFWPYCQIRESMPNRMSNA